MKTLLRLLTLAAIATFFALPAFAQDAAAAAAADPCTTAGEDELYKKYYDEKNVKKDQAAAYETAKQYLSKYPACTDRYSSNVKKFHDAYAAALGEANEEKDFLIALYGSDANKTGRNVAKAFEIGKRMLAKDANNLPVLIQLGHTGYTEWANKNPAFVADSTANLRKSLQLIEAGKTIDKWTPFASRDEAVSYLNFYLGELTITNKPAGAAQTAALKEALPIYLKAATMEGPAKKLPDTYARLAVGYQVTQYAPMLAEYTKMYPTESEESKAALEQLNQVMDRIIDAYARAINLAGSEPRYAKDKAAWTQELTSLYKFRHADKPDGLAAYIAGITATPLPEPFTAKPFVATPVSGTGGTPPAATAEKKP